MSKRRVMSLRGAGLVLVSLLCGCQVNATLELGYRVPRATGEPTSAKVVSVLQTILHQQEREATPEDSEAELRIEDLYPGMVLPKDLFNAQGILVLPKGSTIDEKQLDQLTKHQQEY